MLLELLRVRNFVYTHGSKFGYEPKFGLEELRAALESNRGSDRCPEPLKGLIQALLMELLQCREYTHPSERPMLCMMQMASDEGVKFPLKDLIVPSIQALANVFVDDPIKGNSDVAAELRNMESNFQDNPPELKLAALSLFVNCLEVSDRFRLKNKEKDGAVESKGKDEANPSKSKNEKFTKRLFQSETCKYIGEYREKGVLRKVVCYREDRNAVYAIDPKQEVIVIDSLQKIQHIAKLVEESTIFEERQLMLNLKALILNNQLLINADKVLAPAMGEKLQEEEDDSDEINTGVKDIIDAEDKFSNYLDQYWGSRWKNNLGVDFRSAMRSAKSLAEKAKVVSHLWDRCGYIECLYFEDNQPTAQSYNRRYTIADIIKKGGYLSVSSEEKPLERLSSIKNLFYLEIEDPNPTMFFICCQLVAIQLDKYAGKKCAYLEKVRERYAKNNAKADKVKRVNTRLQQNPLDEEESNYRGALRDKSKKDNRNLKVAFEEPDQKSNTSGSIEKYANSRKFKKQVLRQTKLTDLMGD